MENHGEHKRDKYLFSYWVTMGIGLGILIGASTATKESHEWGISITSGLIMGVLMALFATKRGVNNR